MSARIFDEVSMHFIMNIAVGRNNRLSLSKALAGIIRRTLVILSV